MLAGTLAGNGYDPGIIGPPSVSNPKGYFEDSPTVDVNNRLLQPLWPAVEISGTRSPLPRSIWMTGRDPIKDIGGKPILGRDLQSSYELFFSVLPSGQYLRDPSGIQDLVGEEIKRALSTQHQGARPFLRKDPRLCYTLDAWRPQLDRRDVAYVCIFRSPGASANSILKHVDSVRSWRDLGLTYDGALKLWEQSYAHVLRRHRHSGDWLFVHYDQVFDGTALPVIAEHLDIPHAISGDFADTTLRRSTDGPATAAADAMYAELCDLADFTLPAQRIEATKNRPSIDPVR